MPGRTRGNPDRHVIVFSDVEMGAGGAVDDFPNSGWLGDRIRAYGETDLALDLVFNGDTFDLLKTSYRGAWPTHVTSEVAVGKMARVADAHPAFFESLRDVLARRGDRRVHFVAGNHDLELLFPEVQRTIRALLRADDRVVFHDHGFELGRVWIEHGSQLDPLFRVDPHVPFLEHESKPILNLSWTSVALLDLVIPLQERLGHYDRLKPRKVVLDLVPELREYLSALAWQYWTRDWWRDFFGKNGSPVKRLSWTMLKEIVYRTVSFDLEVALDSDFQKRLEESDRYDVYCLGHVHDPAWWSFGDRKVLRGGCLRDELMIRDHGRTQTLINKTWCELFLHGDEVVRSQIVEEVSPPRPAGTMPESIFEAVPWLRAQLGNAQVRSARAAIDAEESRERAISD